MKTHEFDAKFEADEDVTEDLDLTQIKKPMLKQKRVNVKFSCLDARVFKSGSAQNRGDSSVHH